MKNIVKILFIAALGLLTLQTKAQTRISTLPSINQGTFLDFGNAVYPATSDSLQVSDSIAYIIPILHTNRVSPYINWQWTKVGSGTATVTLTFLQGNDPTKLFAVTAGAAQSTYSKTYTLSATGTNEIDFQRDTAYFNGRYLKIYFITSSTASVKGHLSGRLKTNIQ